MKDRKEKNIFIIHNFKELCYVNDVEKHIKRDIEYAFDVE